MVIKAASHAGSQIWPCVKVTHVVLALKAEDIVKSNCSLPLCGGAKVPEERLRKAVSKGSASVPMETYQYYRKTSKDSST